MSFISKNNAFNAFTAIMQLLFNSEQKKIQKVSNDSSIYVQMLTASQNNYV